MRSRSLRNWRKSPLFAQRIIGEAPDVHRVVPLQIQWCTLPLEQITLRGNVTQPDEVQAW